MHDKSLLTLDYPKIIERLAGEAAFSASKALARALLPSADPAEIARRLARTTEAVRLLEQRADAGIGGARDVRPHATAAARGVALAPSDLLEVLATLRAADTVGRMILKLDDSFPLLKGLAADLPSCPALAARIEASIGEEGNVLDAASPALRRLRLELRAQQQRLQERLGTLVNEFRAALQDPIITMRSDRYVLPVRAEARGQVRGIVHDQSGSGATIFIEPLVIVEMNNRLRELQAQEQQEVERILRELSAAAGHEAPALELAVVLLAEIDLCLAKARYAGLLRAHPPQLDERGTLRLRQARHPLLTGRVVPLDFWLDAETRMVVITGPNTGGKTVALRTVGLLCLMAQAGLHIPAADDSRLPVYDGVFADIGDEQSIEQSLSTFSSHQSRIAEILGAATDRSLVLLDELGAGTDPTEGAALARAILEYLLRRGIATVATTHYSELKVFAHEQPGATNASVEFDVETLSPTYRLSIGMPGRSNALAIAARIGVPAEILERAREYVGTTGIAMEHLLADLAGERQAAADERYHLSMERAEAEHQRREAERARAALEEERVRILNDARDQAHRELDQVRAELARIRTEARRARLDDARLDALRARARGLEERTTPVASRAARVAAAPVEEVRPGAPEVGDAVFVRSMGQRGEVVALADSRGAVEVRMGALRLRVPERDVVRLSRRQEHAAELEAPALTITLARAAVEAPDLQLDLRGWRVEDSLEAVDRYLGDAHLAGMPFVRILHGKGTGALRQAIRQQLARHPLVRAFAPAAQAEGGDGVTVVTLAG